MGKLLALVVVMLLTLELTRRQTTEGEKSSNKSKDRDEEDEEEEAEDSGWVKPDHPPPPPRSISDLESEDLDTYPPAKRREIRVEAKRRTGANMKAQAGPEAEIEHVWVRSPTASTSLGRHSNLEPDADVDEDEDEDVRMRDGSVDIEDLESSVVVDKATRGS